MAAREHHAEHGVAHLVFPEDRIDAFRLFHLVRDGLGMGGKDSLASEMVQDLALGDGHDPGAGVVRYGSERPLGEGLQQGLLDHVFGKREIAHAEDLDQERQDATRLMPEEMFHRPAGARTAYILPNFRTSSWQ